MKVFLLLAVVVAANAKATPGTCRVSEWGAWSDWNAPNHDKSIKSFPVTERVESDGANRAKMMSLMQEQTDLFTKCMAEGTCPQFDNRQIDGFTACVNGEAITPTATYSCSNVDHASFVPTLELFPNPAISGGKQTNDIWGWVDPTDNEQYVIVGMNDGVSFVRVTDAVNPVVLGHLVTATGASVGTWRDIKVFADHAFIVSEHSGHGMQVFDLARLRGLDGSVKQRFTEDAYYGDTGNTHNIVGSSQGFMYLVGSTSSAYPNNCQGGLHAIDVSDPTNPTFAGCYGGDGYVHDAECLIYNGPDTEHQGKEICFCYNENTLTIVDVSDKSNMNMLSRSGYLGASYTHQGWITEDHTTVLLDDELDESNDVGGTRQQRTYIWDVRDLDAPTLENTYFCPLNSIDHNQYIFGDLTYQANYRTGLRILRIDQAAFTLTEVAHFDVYPDGDGAVFNGAWSNYRFSPDKVVITSSEYGVYVLQPNVSAIEAKIQELDNAKKSIERRRYRSIISADDETSCPSLIDVETK